MKEVASMPIKLWAVECRDGAFHDVGWTRVDARELCDAVDDNPNNERCGPHKVVPWRVVTADASAA